MIGVIVHFPIVPLVDDKMILIEAEPIHIIAAHATLSKSPCVLQIETESEIPVLVTVPAISPKAP